ncbi:MAG: stage III sporulation protein AD [Zhaonellaceae bacterium]|jgi:stage III sporulation protein AD|nr:stage III sporulation protein AD [Clostridia bacterium]
MNIVQIVALGLLTTIIIVLLKQNNANTYALLLSTTAGVIIFVAMINKIGYVIQVFNDLARRANVNQFYLGTILKIVGIAYIAEFGAQVCKDAGESSIAGRIELAGKIFIMVLAMPIVAAVLESIIRLLP